jgi:hypothetical protein
MENKRGCYGCVHADWDADGCTCRLDGLNVWNASKGCKYRKEKAVTNGDRIRAMNDKQLSEYLETLERRAMFTDSVTSSSNWLQWLKKEAEP